MVMSKAWSRRKLAPCRVQATKLRKAAPRVIVPFIVVATAIATAVTTARPASASSVTSDQSQIAQVEAKIASEGTALQQLVGRTNATQTQLTALQHKLAVDKQQLVVLQTDEAVAAANLRKVAVQEYVDGPDPQAGQSANGSSLVSRADSAMVESEYVKVAGLDVTEAIQSYTLEAKLVATTTAATENLSRETQQTVATLGAQRQAALQALAADEATLNQVKGNLVQLLAAAQAKQEAAQHAAEQALATSVATVQAPPAKPTGPAASGPPVAEPPTTAQATTTTTTRPPVRTSPALPSPPATFLAAPQPAPTGASGYANPLRSVAALNPERVDQGVDYSGYGPIYAIGDGLVLSTSNGGWPGGTYIAYKLTSGPAAGLTVYAAEDIYPSVSVGETVTPDTVLGTLYEGPEGMETGWADGGIGTTMAYGAGQFSGSNSTAFGYNFSSLLASLGAPSGILQNTPPTGALPSGWPQW